MMPRPGHPVPDDGTLETILKNLLVWSASVGGPKTKPSQLQAGRSYMADLRVYIDSSDVDQYASVGKS